MSPAAGNRRGLAGRLARATTSVKLTVLFRLTQSYCVWRANPIWSHLVVSSSPQRSAQPESRCKCNAHRECRATAPLVSGAQAAAAPAARQHESGVTRLNGANRTFSRPRRLPVISQAAQRRFPYKSRARVIDRARFVFLSCLSAPSLELAISERRVHD